MTSCSRLYFSVSFPFGAVSAFDLWQTLAAFLRSQEALPFQFSMSQIAGHPKHIRTEADLQLSPAEVETTIAERHLTGFHVDTGHTEKSVAYTFGGGTLVCRIENKAKAPGNWSGLIEGCLSRFRAIGGWHIFWPYRTWQNANRLSFYNGNRYGPLPTGFRTWHEPDSYGIGPGQSFIDISRNPGRTKELAPGIDFYPTAEMWLGPHFWQYAKCTKEEALAADFFIEKRDTPHYLYLKCWPQPFIRPDGEEGRMQQRLWKLFFQEDCEWPPGSGTICDEPMYGPPELMPGYQPQS